MPHVPTVFVASLLALSSFFNAPADAASRARNAAARNVSRVRITDEVRRTQYMASFEQHVVQSYFQTGLAATGLPADVYRQALVGYYNLRQRGMVPHDNQVLTIIDFNRSSRLKRLWVVDLRQQRLLFHTLVAHGKNTGEEFATAFSNREGSEMSSLGFYRTGRTYTGKHGLSLRLQGLDPGFNTNADDRDVVVHGAEYVCEDYIRQHGRLGRSQGCPALPMDQSSGIVRAIQGGSVVYAHAPAGVAYQSNWLLLDPALLAFAHSKGLSGS